TDIDGTAEAVAGSAAAGRIAVVIGAGGAARAAFAYLADRGCSEVRVVARNADKAAAAIRECGLQAQIILVGEARRAIAGASLLINATQLGMRGQEAMPGDILDGLGAMRSDAVVFDMVYVPLETELLKAARKH